MKISACIITFNEARNIRQAIESVSWADEILVIDSESTDDTRELAQRSGAKVLVQKWLGFGKQKQFAVDNCAYDWIFSLDADEQVSPELRAEIERLKNSPESALAQGYKIPRLTFYMNRPIHHSGWYPDWQLRFFNRQFGKWKDSVIHESVQMREGSKVERLRQDILHPREGDALKHHRLIGDRYAPLAAEQMLLRGKNTSKIKIATVGFTTFIQTYLLKLGFLDGFPGFCIACFAAHHDFLKHLILWEIQNKNSEPPAPATIQ